MTKGLMIVLVVSMTAAVAGMNLAGCAGEKTAQTQKKDAPPVPWSTRAPVANSPDATAPQGTVPHLVAGYVPPPELRASAIALLMKASDSSNALLRKHALEALQPLPDQVEPLARRGLVDDNRAVRFAAAMTIGQLKLTESAYLLEPLLADESASVRVAAIYGLRSCGKAVDLNPLAKFILDEDPEVRANTAMVMGMLGDRSAAKVIHSALNRPLHRASTLQTKIVELQMAAAMVKLGDDSNLEVMRACLFAPAEQGELTALACELTAEVHDTGVIPDLYRMAVRDDKYRQPAEVRMAATFALAQMAPDRAPIDVPLGYVNDQEYILRHQAALTLGRFSMPAALPVLEHMMGDPNPLVQVAAAGAIVRILGPGPVAAGQAASAGSGR